MKTVVKENAFCFSCSKAALNTRKHQVLAWFDLDSFPAFILLFPCFFLHTMSLFRLCVNNTVSLGQNFSPECEAHFHHHSVRTPDKLRPEGLRSLNSHTDVPYLRRLEIQAHQSSPSSCTSWTALLPQLSRCRAIP